MEPSPRIDRPALPDKAGTAMHWGRLYGAAPALALASARRIAKGPLIAVAPDVRTAEMLRDAIAWFDGNAEGVRMFPGWETLPYDRFSPHDDIVSERLSVFGGLGAMTGTVIVTTADTLLFRTPPTDYVSQRALTLETGQTLDLTAFKRHLEEAGYRRVSEVMAHGEYAIRGSLLDLYPMGTEQPYRVDLFDDDVEAIRTFDPATQRSLETLERVKLLPAHEYPMDADSIAGFRRAFRSRFEGNPSQSVIYRDISDGSSPGGIEYYLPLFFDETGTFFDYLPKNATIIELDGAREAAHAYLEEMALRHEQRAGDRERPVLEPGEIALTADEYAEAVGNYPHVIAGRFERETGTAEYLVNFAVKRPADVRVDAHAEDSLSGLKRFIEGFDGRVLITADSPGRREALAERLRSEGISLAATPGWRDFCESVEQVAITDAPLEDGLLLPDAGLAIVIEEQIFGERVRQRKRKRKSRDPEAIIRELTDLTPGAPVVHEDHGVGRYGGLVTLEVGGIETEFLLLEYRDDDKLYVPVAALDRVTRYTGAAPEHAPLHKLGGDQWEKTRRRAAERIRDVAAELLDIYARRAARKGHAFALPQPEYHRFVEQFPFDETPDQATVIEQVENNLVSASPMDRVVCGDVGFGKTEVALRAAFVTVMGGKQVCVLVPTTLLAQQHYQTFADRFADWPVRVELLSRFRSGKASKTALEGLKDGTVDIVIGTHKLLQDSVAFSDLGLVVIDEEHRFGVRHKEQMKSMRSDVDVLTLTATPIPRTLNMALGGLRDLSLITTPPSERLAIKTFVTEWSDGQLHEAVLREIRRGGQIFFVHNRVETIEATADKIRKLIPEARTEVAHGQMRERDLERVMLDFYHRRFNLLCCTTIIESGIDIPTANTIVIDRADRFGLAQLHQLRGRVGRSHHRAYAYLLVPPRAQLTGDAIKRLEAIESMEDLGAGFTLATHDLEIRGAGELLGDEQSGQIQRIGFALYSDMLERAVNALRDGRDEDLLKPLKRGPDIDLHVPALIPEDYMPDVHVRLILYKRIAGANTSDELDELRIEMIDRFGLLPAPTQTLFQIAAMKPRARLLGIGKIDAGNETGRVHFSESTAVDPLALAALIQREPARFRFDGATTLRFNAPMHEPGLRLAAVDSVLAALEPLSRATPAAA